jgi:hypothetical protein
MPQRNGISVSHNIAGSWLLQNLKEARGREGELGLQQEGLD